MKITRMLTREMKKFHITYTQFFVVIIAVFNCINLFLTPLALFGIVPLTWESYFSIIFTLVFVAFISSTILYKIGAFQEAVLQTFDLQQKILAIRTSNWTAGLIAKKMRMTNEELDEDIAKWAKLLSLDGVE